MVARKKMMGTGVLEGQAGMTRWRLGRDAHERNALGSNLVIKECVMLPAKGKINMISGFLEGVEVSSSVTRTSTWESLGLMIY